MRTSIDVALTDTNDAITADPPTQLEHGDDAADDPARASPALAAGGVSHGGPSSGAKMAIGVAALPLVAMSAVLMVIGGARRERLTVLERVRRRRAPAQTIGSVTLDAEQMGNAQTIVVRRPPGGTCPCFAAVVAVDTAYTESSAAQLQHRRPTTTPRGCSSSAISIYTKAVADDPVKATNAFLDRLVKVADWQTNPVGVDAQTVQLSGHPERYQPNAALAQQIVGQLWGSAAATSTTDSAAGGGSATSTRTFFTDVLTKLEAADLGRQPERPVRGRAARRPERPLQPAQLGDHRAGQHVVQQRRRAALPLLRRRGRRHRHPAAGRALERRASSAGRRTRAPPRCSPRSAPPTPGTRTSTGPTARPGRRRRAQRRTDRRQRADLPGRRGAVTGGTPAGTSSARPATTSPAPRPSRPGSSSPASAKGNRAVQYALDAARQALRVRRRRPERLRLLRVDDGRLGRRRRRAAALRPAHKPTRARPSRPT